MECAQGPWVPSLKQNTTKHTHTHSQLLLSHSQDSNTCFKLEDICEQKVDIKEWHTGPLR